MNNIEVIGLKRSIMRKLLVSLPDKKIVIQLIMIMKANLGGTTKTLYFSRYTEGRI
jgi:hypothetical protein